ncbi:MAG: YaiI/YqxD family protein [Bdellovibrionales bacterium]|nr:YaiI/YqxD family protein [Bdellovibrionales bacterium]
MLNIYIDADACPVKNETYKVAARYKLTVYVVANQHLNVPLDPLIRMETVSGGFDAADDWIVEQANAGDVVITSDILLAQRCVEKHVRALSPKGDEWTEDNIGSATSHRELMQNLRHMGERHGPAAMTPQNRSQFLNKLDQIIQSEKNKRPK